MKTELASTCLAACSLKAIRLIRSLTLNVSIALAACIALLPTEASADQYLSLTRPKFYQGDLFGEYNSSESVRDVLFSADESPIINKVSINGILLDNYKDQLRTTDIRDAGIDMPYHLLGLKKNLISNSVYKSLDMSGEMIIELTPNPYRADGCWDISAIEVQTLNIAGLTDPILTINGEDIAVNPALEYDWSVRTIEPEEGLTRTVTLSVETAKPIAFSEIRLQLREPREFPDWFEMENPATWRPDCRYFFPGMDVGGLPVAEEWMECVVYRLADLQEIACADYNRVGEYYEVTIQEAGMFGVCYRLTNSVCGVMPKSEIKAEHLIPFRISNGIAGWVRLNDSFLEDGVSYIHEENPAEPGRTWKNATLSYIPENATVYWRMETTLKYSPSEEGDASSAPASVGNTATLSEEEEDIPEGYTKYDPEEGIDLTSGDILHLLVRTPGAPDQTLTTRIMQHMGPTMKIELNGVDDFETICRMLRDGTLPEARYYLMDGTAVGYDSLQPGTMAIGIAPTGETLKFIR